MMFSQMEHEQIAEGRRDYGRVLAALRGRRALWHTTNVESLRAIMATGRILPSSEDRPTCWGDHFGRQIGAVCLFDFDTASEDEILSQARNWGPFLTHHCDGASVAIEIARDRLDSGALCSWLDFRAESFPEGLSSKRFPYVEAWHRAPIPVAAAVGYMVIGRPDGFLDAQHVAGAPEALAEVETLAAEWTQREKERRKAQLAKRAEEAAALPRDSALDDARRAGWDRVRRMQELAPTDEKGRD